MDHNISLSIPERYAQNNNLYYIYKVADDEKLPIYNASFAKYKDKVIKSIQEEDTKIDEPEEKANNKIYLNEWDRAKLALSTMREAFRTDDIENTIEND